MFTPNSNVLAMGNPASDAHAHTKHGISIHACTANVLQALCAVTFITKTSFDFTNWYYCLTPCLFKNSKLHVLGEKKYF